MHPRIGLPLTLSDPDSGQNVFRDEMALYEIGLCPQLIKPETNGGRIPIQDDTLSGARTSPTKSGSDPHFPCRALIH